MPESIVQLLPLNFQSTLELNSIGLIGIPRPNGYSAIMAKRLHTPFSLADTARTRAPSRT